MKKTPSVSLVLICYNQEKFINASLISCLQQDYKNLEIVISDDCSTDDTYKIISETLESHIEHRKIRLNRNKENLGIGKHFAHIMDNLVTGELVVMCAGDDIFKDNRVTRIVEEWSLNGEPSLVSHNLIEIDETGKEFSGFRTLQYGLQDLTIHTNKTYSMLEFLKHRQPIHFIGAANSYKLETYKKFNTPKTFLDYEDHLMYFRALLDDGVHYFDEKLIYYRHHKNDFASSTNKKFHDNKSSVLSFYFDKNNKIKDKYIQCYQTHKITVQQWFDYKHSISTNNTDIDYQLVENLWKNIMRRHNYLVENISIACKIKQRIKKKFNILDKFLLPKKITYIKPLNTVIFGTSKAAKNIVKNSCSGFNFIAACNTIDDNLRGKKLIGLDIVNLDDLARIENEVDCILIASNKNYFQIKKVILDNTNITKNRIVRVPALLLD